MKMNPPRDQKNEMLLSNQNQVEEEKENEL